MESIFDLGPPPPCPVPYNAAADVLAAARATPDAVALEVVGGAHADIWTFARLEGAVLGLAGTLGGLGLPQGARVLFRLGNTVEFPVAFLACLAAGLVPVPTAQGLTQSEVTKLAAALRPDMVLAAEGVALPGEFHGPVLGLGDLRRGMTGPPGTPILGDPDRLGYVLFTSGSGGTPRPVAHAHRAIWARRMMHDGWLGLRHRDRVLHAGAFNWSYTLGVGLLDPWSRGSTSVVVAEGVPVEALPEVIDTANATIFAAVSGVYRQVLRYWRKGCAPQLRHGLSAGEKLPEPIREAWRAATGTEIHEAIGMTECSTFISGAPGVVVPRGAIGRPQPGRRIAVLDEDNRPVPVGTPGQLAVGRGDPGLFLGYLDQPEATARHLTPEWFLTGDMAVADAEGFVTHLGRRDGMLTAGGFRVSPVEIEAAFADLPGLTACAAVEITLRADTTLIALGYTGAEIDSAQLAAHGARTLARYKQPRVFAHVDTLPRGGNGKLDRRALRILIEARHGQA